MHLLVTYGFPNVFGSKGSTGRSFATTFQRYELLCVNVLAMSIVEVWLSLIFLLLIVWHIFV